jgi:hypothetical protein
MGGPGGHSRFLLQFSFDAHVVQHMRQLCVCADQLLWSLASSAIHISSFRKEDTLRHTLVRVFYFFAAMAG